LAAGVAHDFNNLITVIRSHVELLSDELDRDDPHREDLCAIDEAAERAAGLARQLLAFSRRQALDLQVISLGEMLAGAEAMLRTAAGPSVGLSLQLEAAPDLVRADRSQLERAVLNLVINARDAIAAHGRITIRTRNDAAARSGVRCRGAAPGTGWVHLEVRDNGVGMDAATLDRIFEPFFSTKQLGRGTGLGLATVQGNVEQIGGQVIARSELRRGTAIDIVLPACAGEPTAPMAGSCGPQRPGRGETVLVVEDDAALRRAIRRTLMRERYQVIEAESGEQALADLARGGAEVAVVLTDVVLGGMSGGALAAHVAARFPAVRLLFMSSHARAAVLDRAVCEGHAHFLRKPFVCAELLDKLQQVLDAADRAACKTRSAPPAAG